MLSRDDARAAPLPPHVRAVLEPGFRADLAAVRVYHDVTAARVAFHEGARAFTTGRDIFFAQGAFEPHTADGMALIAHETAHVLQQTGRVAADGRMVATARYGSGEAQHFDPPPVPLASMRDMYRGWVSGEAQTVRDSVDAMIGELEGLLGADAVLTQTLGAGTTDEHNVNPMTAFEQRVKNGDFDGYERMARSLLYDVLKMLWRFEGAAHLITVEPLLESAVPVDSFLMYTVENDTYGFNWHTAMFAHLPAIGRVFPDRFLEGIYRYLFNPARGAVASGDMRATVQTFNDSYETAFRTAFFKPNERVRGAYGALEKLNDDLQSMLERLDAGLTGRPAVEQRLLASHAMVALANGWQSNPRQVYRDMSTPAAAIARRAVAYWTEAARIYRAMVGDSDVMFWGGRATAPSMPTPDPAAPVTPETVEQSAPAEALVPQAPPSALADPAFAAFVSTTTTHLNAVLALADQTLPTPSAYATTLRQLRTALERARRTMGERVYTVMSRSQLSDETPPDAALWLGVAQGYIGGLLQIVEQYDAAADQRFVDEFQREDMRLYHRYRMAQFASMLARMVGNAALLALSEAMRNGADLGRSYLALVSDWYEDTTRASGGRYLSRDFDAGYMLHGVGITASQLDRLLYLTNQDALNAILGSMLRRADETGDLSPDSYGMIQRALRLTRERAPMPKRWKMDQFAVVWNPVDASVAERANLGAMITDHPRFQQLLDLEDHRNSDYAVSRRRTSDVFVWFIPDLQRVVSYLLSLPVLGEILERELGATPTVDNILGMLDELWRRATADEHTAEDRAALDEALADINAEVGIDIGLAHRQRERLYREATTHDRRVIAQQINTLLETYADDASVTNYVIPNRVIDLIDRFQSDIPIRSSSRDEQGAPVDSVAEANRTRDLEHRRLQMLMLTLEIAPDMRRAFVREGYFGTEIQERRFDIITSLYGYVNRAREFIGGDISAFLDPQAAAQAATDAATALAPITHASQNAATLIADAREPLNVLLDSFNRVIEDVQRKSGFGTNEEGSALVRVGSGQEWPNERTFTFQGSEIQIRTIHTPFFYHQSYGRGTDAHHPAIVTHHDGSPFADPHQALVTYGFMDNDDTVTLYADSDEATMDEFSRRVQMVILAVGLEELADMIEYAVQTGMDIALAFVPGGPAARTLIEFVHFLAVEMPNIQEQLLDDPLAVVHELTQFISPELRDQALENLWMWVLLRGDLPFEERLRQRERRTPSSPRSTTTRARGKFGRLAAFARSVIGRILTAFLNLRDRVRLGMVRAHRMVVRRPMLQRVLGALPTLIDLVDSLPEGTADRLTEVVAGVAEGDPAEMVRTHLREALDELFDGLNGLEVPTEILPFELLVDVIVEKFLGMIKGVRGTVIRTFMDTTGLRAHFSAKIAELLDEQGINPNRLWEGAIRDNMQGMLEESRVSLIEGINGVLRSVFGDQLVVGSDGLGDVQVTFDASVPDLAAMPDEDDEPAAGDVQHNAALHPSRPIPSMIDPAAGVPLAATTRAQYEHQFGHDFGHVRLHTGRRASDLSAYFGARALTSGSHIVLGKDVPVASAQADVVLRHELAHVLQQTGSRPLSLPRHDLTPRLGTPRRGLVVDARREAAAERMARRALRRTDDPVEVEGGGGAGWFPSLSATASKAMLNEISDEDITLSVVDQIQSIPRSALRSAGRGFSAATVKARTIWNAVRVFLRRRDAAANHGHTNAEPFETADALGAISAWFGRSNDVGERIERIAYSSRRIRANNSVELDRRKFLTNLEVYIYGSTGVNVHIDRPALTMSDDMPFTPQFAVVNDIDLGLVNANSNLYTVMKTNTDAHMGAQRFSQEHWWILREAFKDDDQPARIWHHAGAGGPAAYRLNDAYTTAMRTFIAAIGTGNVGPWADYLQTGSLGLPTGGLRVGTHGQLTGSGARQGRQSHHVPQFLLVEYFENISDTPTSRVGRRMEGRWLYPAGIVASGGEASAFQGTTGRIDFKTLDQTSGRGDGLPAVSLAARTHQRGRLHLNAASSWGEITADANRDGVQEAVVQPDYNAVEYTANMAQGIRMDTTFYAFLRRRMASAGMTGPHTSANELITESLSAPQRYTGATYEAIRDTYHWIYGGMIASMRVALNNEDLEAAEYRKSALLNAQARNAQGELTAAYTPRVTALAAVVAAVETKNREVMSQWRRG